MLFINSRILFFGCFIFISFPRQVAANFYSQQKIKTYFSLFTDLGFHYPSNIAFSSRRNIYSVVNGNIYDLNGKIKSQTSPYMSGGIGLGFILNQMAMGLSLSYLTSNFSNAGENTFENQMVDQFSMNFSPIKTKGEKFQKISNFFVNTEVDSLFINYKENKIAPYGETSIGIGIEKVSLNKFKPSGDIISKNRKEFYAAEKLFDEEQTYKSSLFINSKFGIGISFRTSDRSTVRIGYKFYRSLGKGSMHGVNNKDRKIKLLRIDGALSMSIRFS